MRAVNLIPDDAVRGGGGGGGGQGALVLLGALAALLVGVSFYVLTSNTVVDRKAELSSLRTQARTMQAQADATRPYRDFAALAQARVETVRQLGSARFDWHSALGDLAKVVPDNVWLTSLFGTVAPGVSVSGGGSGGASSLRGSVPDPAIELTGCTTDHDSVVRLISRLRLIDGVERVSLADSAKDEGGAGGGCRHGHADFPQFDLVVFFAPLPVVAAPTGTGTTAATSASGTPVPSGSAPAPTGGATAPSGSAPAPTGSAPAPSAPVASPATQGAG